MCLSITVDSLLKV